MDTDKLNTLLLLWSEQQISESELAELTELLKDGRNRTYAYSFFHLTSSITDALKESSAGDSADGKIGEVPEGLDVAAHDADALSQNQAPAQAAAVKLRSSRRLPLRAGRSNSKARLVAAAYAIAASILLMVGAYVWINWQGGTSMAVVESAPPGGVVWRNGVSKPLAAGTALFADDRIVNSSSGPLEIKYAKEDTVLELFPLAELKLAVRDGQKQLNLRTGKLSSKVAKQPAGKPMLLETPYATATVLGTQFVLSVAASDSMLDVSEGAVRFHNDSDSVEVTAGKSAVASASGKVYFNVKPGLIGTYFVGMDLNPEDMKLQRIDPNLDMNWDKVSPAPELPRVGFSARWTGVLKAPSSGRYTLHVLSDDGCGIWIGNKQIMYKIIPKTPLIVDWSGPVDLEQGFQDFSVDYVQGAGGAYIKMFWSKENEISEQVIPPEAFWHFGDIKK